MMNGDWLTTSTPESEAQRPKQDVWRNYELLKVQARNMSEHVTSSRHANIAMFP